MVGAEVMMGKGAKIVVSALIFAAVFAAGTWIYPLVSKGMQKKAATRPRPEPISEAEADEVAMTIESSCGARKLLEFGREGERWMASYSAEGVSRPEAMKACLSAFAKTGWACDKAASDAMGKSDGKNGIDMEALVFSKGRSRLVIGFFEDNGAVKIDPVLFAN